MFALKKETDYAVQLLKYLKTKKRNFVSLMDFSKESGISFWFLQKIARKLNLASIIEAEQGVKGGYRLHMPVKNLNLYRVFEIMEGKMAITSCLASKECACGNLKKQCNVQKITTKLNKAMIKMMQKVRIA